MKQHASSRPITAHQNRADSARQVSQETDPKAGTIADLAASSLLQRAHAAKRLNRTIGNARLGHLMSAPLQRQGAAGARDNRTGLPDPLKAGLEQLSGMDLSDVRVHANSAKPAQVNALAYTQGRDIELGPGQERYLAHEGWHAVQQMQGRVKPTMQAKGVAINDDAALEREADLMGAKATAIQKYAPIGSEGIEFGPQQRFPAPAVPPIQRAWIEDETYHKKWDKLIEGVQWYQTEDGRLWYEDRNPDHRYAFWEGPKQARTETVWDEVEERQNQRRPIFGDVEERLGSSRFCHDAIHIVRQLDQIHHPSVDDIYAILQHRTETAEGNTDEAERRRWMEKWQATIAQLDGQGVQVLAKLGWQTFMRKGGVKEERSTAEMKALARRNRAQARGGTKAQSAPQEEEHRLYVSMDPFKAIDLCGAIMQSDAAKRKEVWVKMHEDYDNAKTRRDTVMIWGTPAGISAVRGLVEDYRRSEPESFHGQPSLLGRQIGRGLTEWHGIKGESDEISPTKLIAGEILGIYMREMNSTKRLIEIIELLEQDENKRSK